MKTWSHSIAFMAAPTAVIDIVVKNIVVRLDWQAWPPSVTIKKCLDRT